MSDYLWSAIFGVIVYGIARQVAGRLQRVTCPFCNLFSQLFVGLATIAQSIVVLQGAIFLTTCLAIDNYAEVGGQGVFWHLCSFYHEPLHSLTVKEV